MVGDWPVAIGEGGAVRLTDGRQLVSRQGNRDRYRNVYEPWGIVYAMDDLSVCMVIRMKFLV